MDSTLFQKKSILFASVEQMLISFLAFGNAIVCLCCGQRLTGFPSYNTEKKNANSQSDGANHINGELQC